MSKLIYSKRGYSIYQASYGYIVHKTECDFKNFHTHINDLDTAKYIVNLVAYKRVPKHLSKYLLQSILRITQECKYKRIISRMLDDMLEADNEKLEKEYSENEILGLL